MGDRCYMSVTVRDCDKEKFLKETEDMYGFSDAEFSDTETTTELEVDEINWGNTDDLPRDIPFIGYHGEGYEYGSREFACDGNGTFMDAEKGQGNDGFVIHFDHQTREPKEGMIENVKAFLEFKAKVRAILDAPVTAEAAKD